MALINIINESTPYKAGTCNYGVIQVQVVSQSGEAVVCLEGSSITGPVQLNGSSPEVVFNGALVRAGESPLELSWSGDVYIGLPAGSSGTGQVAVWVNIVERCK